MHFKRLACNNDNSEDDVEYIPRPSVEHKLTSSELEAEYGIGYKLLLKQGFKTGNALGERRDGLTEPLKAVSRIRQEALGEEGITSSRKRVSHISNESNDVNQDEVYAALNAIIHELGFTRNEIPLWKLRDSIKSSGKGLSTRLKLLLSDMAFLRSFILRYPVLLNLRSGETVSLNRPQQVGLECSCEEKFSSRGSWLYHIGRDFKTHDDYVRSLSELKGDSDLFCLVCSRKHRDMLELAEHAQLYHPSFFDAIIAACFLDEGIYASDLLIATLLHDRGFDWKRVLVGIALSPASVISVPSDEVEDIIDLDSWTGIDSTYFRHVHGQ